MVIILLIYIVTVILSWLCLSLSCNVKQEEPEAGMLLIVLFPALNIIISVIYTCMCLWEKFSEEFEYSDMLKKIFLYKEKD